jgi:hypothetical protein
VPDDLEGHGWQEGTGWQGTYKAHGLPNGKFFMVGHAKGTGIFEGLNVVIRRELSNLMVISTGGAEWTASKSARLAGRAVRSSGFRSQWKLYPGLAYLAPANNQVTAQGACDAVSIRTGKWP